MEDGNIPPDNKDLIVEVRQITENNKPKEKRINNEMFFKLLDLGVKLFWFVFAVIVFKLFYPQIKYDIIPNLTSFKFAGIEATIKKDFDRHNNKYLSNAQFRISPKQQEIIVRRSQTLGSLLTKTKILWVDNEPDNNIFIRKIFREWGVEFECPSTTEEAEKCLQVAINDSSYYDLIISDYNRPPDKDGIQFANEIKSKYDNSIPIILFSGTYGFNYLDRNGIPENIFAATNRYDFLIHFIFDAIERGNAPYPAGMQRYVSDTTKIKLPHE